MSRLHTVSLRRRVTLSVVIVLFGVMVTLVFVVDALFASQSSRDVETVLLDRARTAQQLVKTQKISGNALVHKVDGRGVQVLLTMQDGTTFGTRPDDDDRFKSVVRALPDGATMTFYGDTSVLSAAQIRLRNLLVAVGLGALAVTAGALVFVVQRALAPLDAMTTLARSISGGDRGRRLNPLRTNNELGRTAAAFDDMLDSLEGAETTARASEERTKRFVADAAHELRTPLAGVQAIAEALMQTGLDEAGAEERDRMNLLLVRESRRAGRLVDDLLALARIDAGLELQLERVDLLALAEAEVSRSRLLAADLDIEAEGIPVTVLGDPQRLAQILVNLSDNARQATGPQGKVRLHVGVFAGRAMLTVKDNGPGVAYPDRERIFDRLTRLDEARDRRSGGSGLGLAIARGFARAHGGDLGCTTPSPGEPGAAFVLTLPLSPITTSRTPTPA
ncbi:HAMP domain-containing sensor histidine kinase [Umezawaea sp. Da 62-37]|uniref:sensor histidine kinase n=1 Tax=Umezawaea sp. Da 62-37 TaxID=3075927 RepID=UPI0028F6FB7C|nr:HAMP domain-containing sensor histidine kinase [Umezawaea sp. Da 62-37]WNV82499.1 HAMP domain-containing sensor histidine kinase [Umezawaea sp. Da 62-37]